MANPEWTEPSDWGGSASEPKPVFEPVTVSSYPVSIFIAGDLHSARVACGEICDQIGLCVTVTPTNYVYTHGDQPGVIVGLINYPRFPSDPYPIWQKAERIAAYLCDALGQQSYTIQAPDKTVWYSHRPEDAA